MTPTIKSTELSLKGSTEFSLKVEFEGKFGPIYATAGALLSAARAYNDKALRDRVAELSQEDEHRKLEEQLGKALIKARQSAHEAAAKHGWNKEEVGWSKPIISLRSWNESKQLNRDEIQANLKRATVLRPRDPFPVILHSLLKASEKEEPDSNLVILARRCYDAASIVPQPAVYDAYRQRCFEAAGTLALAASSASPDSQAESQLAVECWTQMLKLLPEDSHGYARENLAFALARDGQATDALSLAEEILPIRKNNPYFYFRYSCILSANGKTRESIEFLEKAIQSGFPEIEAARAEPLLNHVKHSSQKNIFMELLKIRFDWRLDTKSFGWSEDFEITNKSKFPLTNVLVEFEATKGHQTKEFEAKSTRIEVDKTETWKKAVDGVDGSWDISVRLSSDQGTKTSKYFSSPESDDSSSE